jgi:predicted transcriptional regulator of viral defense system
MGERWRITPDPPGQNAKVRVARVAGRQWGRVSRRQLEAFGCGSSTVDDWLAHGYLHRLLPGVYAVGHAAPGIGGDLAAALLDAGPGAMLSHATAAWWLGLSDAEPTVIHVSTPRRCRSRRGIRVHERRTLERVWHRRLTVTALAQTLLDYATTAPRARVRRALAEADYRGILDVTAVTDLLGRGRPGSASLRRALREHQPRLAQARSVLEERFMSLCEAHRIPLPELNVTVHGWVVDAYWPQDRLVVELDGYDNHRSPAQIRRDRRKELQLRGAGLTIARYAYDQIENDSAAVAEDVLSQLGP